MRWGRRRRKGGWVEGGFGRIYMETVSLVGAVKQTDSACGGRRTGGAGKGAKWMAVTDRYHPRCVIKQPKKH